MRLSVTETKTLQERITGRLLESLGDLITDADLKDMVDRGMHAALFEGRTTERRDNTWSNATSRYQLPSLVEELTKQFLEAKMKEAVEAWLRDHPEVLQAAIDQTIREGAGRALVTFLDSRFNAAVATGLHTLREDLTRPRT